MSIKSVLVTGAGSGIGRTTSLQLAAKGLTVFAGTLNASEASQLDGLGLSNLIPVILDIGDLASIDAAVEYVTQKLPAGAALGGLVNVAGINKNAPLHILTADEIRQMVTVNLLGTMLLTRAALPLLSPNAGRLVLVGSATAFLPPPTISVYAATKCAISGFGDSMRVELGQAGIAVSVIEPGVVRTPMTAIAAKILAQMLDRMSDLERARYEKLMRKIVDMSNSPKAGIPPERVAAAITHALTAPSPRARYRVGIDSRVTALLRHLPDGARDFIQRKTFGI